MIIFDIVKQIDAAWTEWNSKLNQNKCVNMNLSLQTWESPKSAKQISANCVPNKCKHY